ncbi:MAG: hypothetical protein K2X66_03135, partial [Cyanobacteria bacterium]|nr:hypothetical protein [Cyanobacteriota bacterium]
MSSKETLSLIFTLLLLFLFGILGLQNGLSGFFYDDGLYLLGARSFAEGTGYIISNLGGSAPIIKYPPLFSLILAPLWFFFPDYPENLPLLKSFNLLLSTLFLGGFYFYLRHFKQFSILATILICVLFACHFTFY